MVISTDLDVTKDELREWIHSPTTQEVFKAVKNLIELEVHALSSGGTIAFASAEATAIATTKAVSRISAFNELLNIKDLLIEEEEES